MAGGPNRDLLSGPIGRTLILFALPTLASSALQSASGSLNTLWVGRFLGEEALAATANGNIVMFLLVAFVFGFGMASTIYVGQAWGRGDADEARRVAGTAIGAFVPIAALVAIGGWFGAPWLLDALGTPEPVVPLALAYLRVVFLSMPAMLMFTLLTMALAFALYRFGGWRDGHLLPLSRHECEQHARCARETTGALAPAA